MKACKIILICIFIIKSFAQFIKALESDEPLTELAASLFSTVIAGLLYWGAGIFDI